MTLSESPLPESPLPDLTRTDVDTVLVSEWTAGAQELSQVFTALDSAPWPPGLLSFTAFESTEGDKVMTYAQWSGTDSGREFVAALTDTEPVEYRLYRAAVRDNPPVPGCVVAVRVEFDGPDARRQRQWVDAVFDALAVTEPRPGGISGHFHVSTDGARVLNYAEWTDEDAHRDALASPEMRGQTPEWQRIQQFPGITSSGFTRYRPLRGLSAPAARIPH